MIDSGSQIVMNQMFITNQDGDQNCKTVFESIYRFCHDFERKGKGKGFFLIFVVQS